ncbi:MAG TPA: sigma-70 family RNA polymerase sigma factor [Terriglobales bacterium]|nr:sigma-70 family RNA polymerase sigma factor [Terriglobales bacterium]
MTDSSTPAKADRRVHIGARHADELYARSGATAYGLSLEQFTAILGTVVARTEDMSGSSKEEIATFLSGLKLDELALAHGCAAGNQHAWDVFLTKYRESIYQAARSITRNESTGRELADSLYAELYGIGPAEERRSKLALYSGRGSLAGWLRMVLSQSFVNQIRAGKRLVSIEEEEEEHGTQFAAAAPESVAPADPRLKGAVDQVLGELSAEERFLLSSYFLDGRRLAEIGRTLGVHESTISRKMEKLLGEVRKRLRKALERRGMSRRQAEEALEVDVRDLELDVAAGLRPPAEKGP